LYLREWGGGRKERTYVLGKVLNSKPTAAAEPEVSKNANQCFFMPTPYKKAKKCKTMTYMPKNTFKKAKCLDFGLKNANLATLVTSFTE